MTTSLNPVRSFAHALAALVPLALLAAAPVTARAQILYVGAGTAHNTAAYATSVTPGLPTGWNQGDLLVIVAHYFGTNSYTINTPAGYTQIGTNTGSTTYGALAVFWKIAGAAETIPTVTLSGATADKFTAQMFAFHGVNATTPIDVAGSITNQAALTTYTGTAVTTTMNQAMVIFAGGSRDDNTWGTWGGSINAGVYTANSASTNDNSVFLGYNSASNSSVAGAQTAPSAVQLTLGADAGRHITFALRPGAPDVPGTPAAASQTANGWNATWTASNGATSYTLEVDDENTFAAPLTATYSPATNSQAVSGLAANTTYYMRVSATGPGGTSAYSATGQGLTLPGAPTMAAYSGIGQTAVTVNWTSPGGAGALTYNVQRAPDAGGTPGVFANVAACQGIATTSCNDTGLTAGTTYWYQVQAVNATGPGAFATPTSVTTNASTAPPSAPGTPTYASVTVASFTVNWTASATGATPITYTLQWSSTGAAPWTNVAGCSGAGLLTCNVTGLSANTRYYYQVVATNAYGNATSASSSQLTLPGTPTMATYTGVGSSSVTVNWTPSGSATGLTYNVQRALASGGPYSPVAACQGISTTSCNDTGLTGATTYWYQAQAVNTAGSSAFATATSVTTTAPALTIADGTNPAGAPICPGASAQVDGFTMQASSGTASVTGVTVALSPAGAFNNVASVQVACGAATGTNSALTSDSVPVSIAVSVGSASATSCTVTATAKVDGLLATVGNLGVQGTVSAVTVSGYTPAISDASNAFTIDNAPPANVVGLAAAAGDALIALSWTNPAADFARAILVRKTGSAVTFVPADGTDYALSSSPVAGETVIYANNGASFTDTPLTNGTTYHYKVIARDACNNWSGADVGSATPTPFVGEGDTTTNSTRPVVAIVNPAKNAVVKAPFKVQARIYSPGGRVVTPAPSLYVDGTPVAMTPSTQYGTTTTSGIWEYQVATLATGSHTLRVLAANVDGSVYSAAVSVTVHATGAGDGNLLVRDNASQMCADCHSMPSHSTESTGAKWGSWATTCRDCHDPHGTKNISLVAEQITPPALTGPQTPKTVVFYNKSGFGPNGYANATGTGPCQVCHTRTTYFKADGTGTGHNPTGDCATCHKHAKGLAAVCTDCHGTAGRTKGATVAGTVDFRLEASPPVDTAGASTGVKVGAHIAHVNQGTYRTNALACADCHPWPNTHQTPSQRDAGWSALASTTGERVYTLAPAAGVGAYGTTWEATPTCTNWCHGAGLGAGGGSITTPNWTLGSTQAACGTCHASPPPVDATAAGDHPQNTACASCHGGDYAQASIGATSKGTHVDGTIQKPLNGCTACHGKLAGPAPAAAVGSTSPTAAPGYDALSVDTRGNTYTTVPLPVGVGAHGKHVNAGMMSAKTCNVCHPLPLDGDTGHANGGAAQMQWSAPATVAVTPTYTSPNCTNYCHSTGDPLGAATPAVWPISWTSQPAGGLGCASCHLTTALATNAHGKHVTKYACNECHVGTTPDGASIVVGGGLHVNGANDVGFDTTSPLGYFGTGSSYTAPSSPTNPATCSNIYCHSNGTDRSAPYTNGPSIAWNAGPTNCTSCHGGPAGAGQIATGKHPNHVNVAGTIGGAASTNFECGTCHSSTVAVNTNSPITGAGAHVDKVASVTIDSFYGGSFTQGATEGTGSCASNYCHSSGQDPAAVPAIIQYRNVAWNDAPLGCDGCHGRSTGTPNGTGAPDYPSGGGGTPTANSHAKHVSAVTDCAVCHAGTAAAAGNAVLATSTLHLDKSRQVQIDAAHDGDGATTNNYTAASKTCNSVTCHGAAGTPVWGGPPLKCSDCHSATTDQDSFTLLTPGVIGTNEWSARGHGQSTFGVNTFPTLAGGTPCLYCHESGSNHRDGTNPFRLRGSTVAGGGAGVAYSAATASSANQVCLNCHATNGANGVDLADGGSLGTNPLITSTKKIDAYHAGAKHGTNNGGTRCWDCHDPHGDGSNLAMIGADVVRTATDNHSFAGTRITGVTFTANATGTDYAGAATRVCNACHSSTLYYLASGLGNQTHQSGAKCVACHVHNRTPNLAFQQSTGCGDCHAGPPANGKHAFHVGASTPAYGDVAPHSTAAAYAFGCGKCHSGTHMNDIGGSAADPYQVQVVFDWTSGATPYTIGVATTDTDPASGLAFRTTVGTCATYCHSNGGPLQPAGTNATPTYASITWNAATGTLACSACHGYGDAPGTMSAPHAKHIRANASSAYAYACLQCHQTTTTAADTITDRSKHVDNVNDQVAFLASMNPSPAAYNTTSFQCASTYCHSNGSPLGGTPVSTTPLWTGGAMAANCTGCHGGNAGTGASAIATNKHPQHTNATGVIGTNYGCVDCHSATVSGDQAILAPAGYAQHVDGGKDVGFPARNGQPSAAYASPACNSNYCHSNGRDPLFTDAARYANVTWTQVTGLGCAGCHGRTQNLNGAPDYADGATLAEANSHAIHTGSGADATSCEHCHTNTVTPAGTAIKLASTVHTDGFRNVDILAGFDLNAGTSNYNGTTKTCSAVSCHGSAATPVWGNALACNACHNAPPTGGAHAKHDQTGTFTAYSDATNQTTAASYGFACNACHQGVHGNSTATGASAATAKYAEVTAGLGYSGGGVTTANELVAASGLNFGYYTDRSCTTSYCHSNGGPLQPAGTNAAPTYAPTTWATTRTCSGCHGYGDAPGTMSAPHAKHIRTNVNSAYNYACLQCHQTTTTTADTVTDKTKHADGVNDQVAFLASLNPSPAGYTTTTFTCASVYCHSNAQAGAARVYKAPKWTDAVGSMPADCSGCHGGNATAVAKMGPSNDHAAHMDQAAAYLGTNIACGRCHAATVNQSNDRAIVSPTGYASHVNGTPDVSMVNVDATAAGTYGGPATKTCSNVYCHSDGTETPTYVNTNLDWDAGFAKTNDCKQCHGTEAGGIAGAPWYTNNPAADDTRNSHPQHVSSAADCVDCHDGTANSLGGLLTGTTLHLNKVGDISAGAGKKIAGTYTQAGETCSSITCHNGGTAQWGGTLTCSDCHTRTTAQGGDLDNWVVNDNTASAVNSDEWTARGHGNATAAYDEFTGATDRCLYCHDRSVLHGEKQTPSLTNPFRLRGAASSAGATGAYNALSANNGNEVCLNCHSTSATVRYGVDPDGAAGQPLVGGSANPAELRIDAWHHGAKHGAAADGGKRCWDCHDPHGDGSNVKMIGADVLRDATDDFGLAGTRATGVTFTANATGTDYAGAATRVCNACHSSTLYYLASGTGNQTHQSGSRCVACHGHNQTPNLAFKEATACNACHNAPPTLGKHGAHDETAFAETSYANNARHASATQYGFACNSCHNGTHMNGTGPYTAQVVFGSFDTTAVGGTYTAGVAQTADTAPTGMLTFNWSNGSCGSTYCHSNAAPVGQTNLAAAPTWNEAAWVKTGGTANECTKCHQVTADNPLSAASTKLSHSHWVHVTTNLGGGYYFNCSQCHNGVATGQSDYPATAASIADKTLHVNGGHNVAFDATVNPGTTGYNQAPQYTCTNTYCHSNGTSAAAPPANTSIAWNSAGSTCASCHPDATTLATGKHSNHVNNNALLGTSYFCGDCHQNTVAAGTSAPVSDRLKHVNRSKDVSIANRGTYASTDTTTTCSATYCHSNGQRGAANAKLIVTWADLAWTSGTQCWGCHGTSATFGAPSYTNGGPNTATSNSHLAHATSSATCVDCHNTTTTTGLAVLAGGAHTNGVITMGWNTATAGMPTFVAGTFTSPSTYTSATCANVKCHGTNATPVTWGATLDCSGCHMGATGATDAEVDNYAYNDGTFAKIDPEDWINYGHGRPTASGAYDSGNGAAGFDTAAAVSADDGCKYCHDETVPHGAFGTSGNPFRLANIVDGADAGTVAGDAISEKIGVCTACHGGAGYLGKTTAKAIDATHYGTKHGGVNAGGELCWDCHDPHGDYKYSATAGVLAYMIDKSPSRTHTAAVGSATEWGQSGILAAATPEFRKALGTSATAWDWGDYARSTLTGVCQVCHTATAHFLSTTWDATAPGDFDHNSTQGRCTGCHAHDQPPASAFQASCTGCHGNKGTPRTPVAGADAMLEYAPPTARDGTTSATTANGVGAHQSHVNQITLRSAALPCSQCHGATLPAAGHPSTGQAPIIWGALATTGGVTPSYVQGTGCSLTYCHGNFKNGNDQVTFTMPAAPANLVFSLVTNTSLTLGWSGAKGAVLYKVERAPDVAGVPGTFVQIGTTSTTSYADGGLFDGTTYWYQVRAWNPSGDGAYSANASQRTTGGLTATEFDMVGEAAATPLGTDGNTNVLTATTTLTPTTGTTFTNKNATTQNYVYANTTRRRESVGTVTNGTTYNYIDLYSPQLTASNLTVGAGVQMSIDLYNAATGTVNGTWTVTLFEYTSGGVSTQRGTCTSTFVSNVTTFQTVGCTLNNTQWTAALNSRLKVRIQTVNTQTTWARPYLLWGATRVTSGTLAGQTYFTASIGTAVTVPAAPTGTPTLTPGTIAYDSVALSWTAVTGATSYIVERGLGASPATWTQVGQPTVTNLVDPGLTGSTIYSYRVRATNAGGAGPNSTPNTTVSTAAPPPSPPVTSWTGTFTAGSTTLSCASCHGNPPGGTHPSVTNCSACHTNYGNAGAVPQAVDTTRHLNGIIEYDGDCITCHTLDLGSRRAVVGEFAMKWSHKRSAGGTVTIWDCVVCHMEGDPATGKPATTGHMDGVVNLRDPDTGTQIQNVTFTGALGGTAAGSYGPGTGDATFTQFSRNLGVPFESDPNFLKLAAIQINQCMKCHDVDGATAFNTGKPLNVMATAGGVTRSAAIPFGTAITYAAVPTNEGGTATAPSGTQTAGGVAGGVIRLDASFLTTNSSYHPVLGRNNNSFVYGTRAKAPYKAGITGRTAASGSVNNFGYLMSCWDCHALPSDTGPISKTVTAHGGTATVRGTPTPPNLSAQAALGSNESTLCKVCHELYDTQGTTTNHGVGSAFASSGSSPMDAYLGAGCNMCHSSGYGSVATGKVPVVRPVRAEDVHGVDTVTSVGGITKVVRWAGTSTGTPAQINARPYAFIRNNQMLSDHSPVAIGGTTYSANCEMVTSPCNQPGGTYTPGGRY